MTSGGGRPGRELAQWLMFPLHLEEANGLLVFCMCIFYVRYIDHQKKSVEDFAHFGFSKPYKALGKWSLFFKCLLRCAECDSDMNFSHKYVSLLPACY